MDDSVMMIIFGVAGLALLIFPHHVSVVLGMVARVNARRWRAEKIDEIAALPEEYRKAATADLSWMDRYFYYPEHSTLYRYKLRAAGVLLCLVAVAGLLS